LRAVVPPATWPKALAALDAELRRALTFGFSPTERDDVVRKRTARTLINVRQARTQSSAELAAALAFSVAHGVVFTSPEDDRLLSATQLATLTAEECQAALRGLLPPGPPAVTLLGPLADEKRDRKMVNATLIESARTPLVEYAAPAPPKPFPYTDFGPTGEVVKNEPSIALEADLIRFANGVRLNLKQTDFEPGRVRLMVRFGSGRLGCPIDQPGLEWRIFAWILGGLRDLSADDERAALIDISGDFTMTSSGEDFRLIADVNPEALPLVFQSTAAYFVRPAFRDDGLSRSLEIARNIVTPFTATATGVTGAILAHRLSSGHPGTRPPNIVDVSARTRDELIAWLTPQLEAGPLEIALVGDFDRALAIDAVARTFGALPPRDPYHGYVTERRMTFPPKPFAETVTFEGPQSVAVVSLAWPAPDLVTFSERLRGQILADILADRIRLKLRSEMGETYAPSAAFTWNDAYTPSPASLACSVETGPGRVEPVTAAMRTVVETLARDGVTAEEFERAQRPRVRDAETGLRDNGWWIDVMGVAQSLPVYAEGYAASVETYRNATVDEINVIARRLFVKENECQLIVTPRENPAPAK
jgi:zinc protease